MTRIRTPHCFRVIALCAAIVSGTAYAQLGSTIVKPLDPLHAAVMQHTQNGQLSFQQSTDANGISVRKYVSSAGDVYAVSWHGPAMPDVEALLGGHYARYRNSASTSQADNGLHASRVSRGDLVVESGVRLREFVGRAWLTSALPAGVIASDIE
ncbi:hypothetical protein AWB67_02340 [Caballeronia terrestris]|uniref:DUF2844 domain-containing protein n=1 Tax=Caballeronia terrestris TaxID=1226301 RepID=A0A158I4N9_9BURK|nr:DUF2844 domain-containing protein [Caballeronia terrestris]SAL51558.1 hypothetical protein AWB67_02340 [Caballeronia terrestris]